MIDTVKVIEKLAYKPGWKFTHEYLGGTTRLRSAMWITACVDDSRKDGEKGKFTMRRTIPEGAEVNLTMFLSWWKDVMLEAEIHEMREFLRYDGDLIDDPHAMEAV